jgi:hypothetical protein
MARSLPAAFAQLAVIAEYQIQPVGFVRFHGEASHWPQRGNARSSNLGMKPEALGSLGLHR